MSEDPDVAPEPEPATIVDMVERGAEIFGYFDADEFRRGAWYRAVKHLIATVPLASDHSRDLTQTCGFDPIEALLEVSLSSRVREAEPDFETAVLVARTNVGPAASLDCLARLLPKLEPADVDGRPALAFGDTGGYIVAVEPYLVIGQAQTVGRALERLGAGARQRVPDEVLYAELRAAELFEAERIVVGAAHTPRGMEWSVLARATSTQAAETIEASVREFRREGLETLARSELEAGVKSLVSDLVESITFERRGADLGGAFGFGSPDREAAILKQATSVIGPWLDQHLKSERIHAARKSVKLIAEMLREYAMNQVPPRFPESGPLIPEQVSAASSYTPADSDWQQGGWKSIEFRWSRPQHFAFGFETTRGGRKVTVRALADLDGDGQHSRLEAELEVLQDKSISATNFRAHNLE